MSSGLSGLHLCLEIMSNTCVVLVGSLVFMLARATNRAERPVLKAVNNQFTPIGQQNQCMKDITHIRFVS